MFSHVYIYIYIYHERIIPSLLTFLGGGGETKEKATEQVPAALLVVINLHRLLLIRYAAYFGSSSPIHPKPGQPTTQELLKGNDGLLRAWNRVLILRKEFRMKFSLPFLLPPFSILECDFFFTTLFCLRVRRNN